MSTEQNLAVPTSTEPPTELHPEPETEAPSGPARTRLKAERVQLRVEPPAAVVKAQRVLDWLRSHPDWRLGSAGNAIVRSRDFPNDIGAVHYAAYLAKAATFARQRVDIDVTGTRVTVAVRGKARPGLSKSALDFAQSCA